MKNNRDKALYKIQDKEICPACGADLLIKSSRHGPFLGCANYPQCDYIQPLKERKESLVLKALPDNLCDVCQEHLVVRQGKFGLFICCVNYPDCDYIAPNVDDGVNVTSNKCNEDVACPKCRIGQLMARQSRYGKTFFGCSSYPKCKFLVNYPPVKYQCPLCNFPILVEKKRVKGLVYACANKRCDFEIDSIKESENKLSSD
ncbi:DNA topoisomerase family protein [Thorsellia kenyensis]|uniref:Topoisomerase DNA-binding C4 zinc finger domain-containing protein n=1 Tax=Thorsellia kenyensis TaxID=1549888 RepID=A0ABV6CAS5_9GAMM